MSYFSGVSINGWVTMWFQSIGDSVCFIRDSFDNSVNSFNHSFSKTYTERENNKSGQYSIRYWLIFLEYIMPLEQY